jgi:hypothetical protein
MPEGGKEEDSYRKTERLMKVKLIALPIAAMVKTCDLSTQAQYYWTKRILEIPPPRVNLSNSDNIKVCYVSEDNCPTRQDLAPGDF